MDAVGIIAEYNPLHSGHIRHINEIRKELGDKVPIVCAMSGNWVQRGDAAISNKWSRASAALRGGVDLVLELPTPWAISSAETFARGGVSVLAATGVVTALSFGSESGDLAALQQAALLLDSAPYKESLRLWLDQGLPFAAARQEALSSLMGEQANLLRAPNDNLGVEYLRAMGTLGHTMTPLPVLRQGADHDSMTPRHPAYASATYLRARMLEGRWSQLTPYLPPDEVERLRQEGPAALRFCARGVLAKLRSLTAQELERLPDSGEGLPHRLLQAAHQARGLEELYDLAKTKRYAHARIRRLVLWAFLGLEKKDLPPSLPYLRVLGLNQRGGELLRGMKKTASLPVLTKPAHWTRLDATGQALFANEIRCTSLYDLCRQSFGTTAPGPGELTQSPVFLPV